MSNLPAAVLTQLLGVRLENASLEQLLGRYVAIAQDGLPGMDEVSITLIRNERPFTAAHTGELALAADELQYGYGYGPCLDAGQSGEVLTIPDMTRETRWPEYASKVAAQGVLSAVSVPLPLQTDLIGALNWYGRSTGVPEAELGAGVELASHVAVAVGNAVTYSDSAKFAADMRAAMASRAVIEQAKGVIMAQNRCGPDQAFEILRTASMGRNVKLRDLARQMVLKLHD
ncbi:GAF and ANTAR domain-containing protein [Kineosporia sp. J2-2]|uniref:GAF and ANTAR domain-containing protein n=1 Tax=Kineosporia corallincola TaxID=2835133 RepID=A0ABS5TEB1_9ACTN|nr:GAF and ANTAR domain-containing protein [Kineosporia corallincola]MBT0769430.1 GAF and ANTAR domain-containing protein [Kineosporia corallincola]